MCVNHYFCGNCAYYGSRCKRIDHKKIRFAIPWFKSYDANAQSGTICSDFYPASYMIRAKQSWAGFDDYWKGYVRDWLPYGNTNTLIYFTLYDDASIRYGVPLMDFVNGTMFNGNTLNAIERMYYKQDRKSPTGYKLIREKIDGIEVKGNDTETLA